MRKELDEALCAKYPKLFRDRRGDVTKTAMCWGFDCGDGWYDIIDIVCLMLSQDPTHQPVVTQVKEKFGTLRFYVSSATDEQYNYISFAETMSGRICEECGAPGKLYGDGWLKTLCSVHAKEQGKETLYANLEHEVNSTDT